MKRDMHIIWYDKVDSTNSEASRKLDSLDNLSVLSAETQFGGRGKDSNVWLAEPGVNLTFSIILKFGRSHNTPDFPARCQMLISAITAATVVSFLAGKGVKANVKWPNDIYVDGKKICGILIEHRTAGRLLESSIVGVGINLNQTVFPSSLPNPVSLSLLTGGKYDVRECLEEYCRLFADKLDSVYAGLPHLEDVVSRILAFEDGTSCNENLRSGFMELVDIFL